MDTDRTAFAASLRTARVEGAPSYGGGWVWFVIDADAQGRYGTKESVMATQASARIAAAHELAAQLDPA